MFGSKEHLISRIFNFGKSGGLLKTAYVPIVNSNGEIRGVTGADVDISIINNKTRKGLYQIIFIGLIAIILSIFVSFQISSALTKPIQNLKNTALKIAAGNFGLQIQPNGPTEFVDISRDFNQMSSSLKSTILQFKVTNKNIEESHNIHYVMQALSNTIPKQEPSKFIEHKAFWLGDTKSKNYFSSDYIILKDKLLVWDTSAFSNPFEAMNYKASIFKICNTLINQYNDIEDIIKNLYLLEFTEFNYFGLLDLKNWKILY